MQLVAATGTVPMAPSVNYNLKDIGVVLMKIKALFVAPYAAMENLIEECRVEEPELDLYIKIGNLQEGVALAKSAEAQGFDVIISRGGTAKLIGEAVGI